MNNSKLISRTKNKPVDLPSIFQLEATNVCNLNCKICPHEMMTREKGYMDFDLFKLIVDRDMGNTRSVGLHILGESLLHPKIVEMINYLRSNNITPELATNATILTKKLSKDLIRAGLKTIWFSFDGGSKQFYEQIRIKAKFDEVIQNILDFSRENKKLNNLTRVIVQMVDYENNEAEKKKFKDFWINKDVGEVKIKFLDSWAGSLFDSRVKSPSKPRILCVEPWERVAVLYNGDVVPCCRDWDGRYIYGNLSKNSLKEIWHNDKVKELRRQMLENDYIDLPCRTCKEWDIPMDRLIVNKKHE